MSGPSTRTLYRFTPWPGGGPSTSPVVTSKTPPCQGHVTWAPSISPSQSGPPTCVQVLSIAWNEPPTLKSAISLPLTSTILALPMGISSVRATFTNSGIGFSLYLKDVLLQRNRRQALQGLSDRVDRDTYRFKSGNSQDWLG